MGWIVLVTFKCNHVLWVSDIFPIMTQKIRTVTSASFSFEKSRININFVGAKRLKIDF